MARLVLTAAVIFAVSTALRADDPAAQRWSVTAECHMIVLPQKLALTLVPDLMEDETFDKGWKRLQSMIEKDEAKVAADLVVKGVAGKKLTSESIEELRYPTEFQPPQLPQDVPKENPIEFLKNWPHIGICPTAFETRNVGGSLELQPNVAADGEWLTVDLVAQHVRLLRFAKYDAGILPSGEHLAIEQPLFYTIKSTLAMHLHAGQRVLAGVHMLPPEEGMELFILRIGTQRTGTKK